MSAVATLNFPMESDVGQGVSRSPSFGILSTYPPTRCGLATFTAALAHWLSTAGADVGVVRVSDGSPSSSTRVIGELVNGSPASVAACTELLNQKDVAVIQHRYDIYGGVDGDEVVDVMDGLRVPSIVIAHNILKNPTGHQRSVLEAIAARADQVVVMSEAAGERLRRDFVVDRHKVATIPYGATVSTNASVRNGRPTLLTWGLLGPGKGIERVIDAMGSLTALPGRPQYLVAGQTHPKVLATAGDVYRDACIERARQRGVVDSVRFDAHYRSLPVLSALIQSAAVVVLPYDSTDQVSSGVLVGAIASGRPVVATAFPHAVELLGSGAGIVVAHDDPDALASALVRVLTQPRLAGAMAAEARRLAPEMAWPAVATAYLGLARRVLADRQVLV
ncbi:glycosyltransferase [Mycobacterium sp. Aquia_216]|uniref:glycosyltransferase n=1 Tax=Mycobacterium sp. Aquia_216 TaxID=2991729 RepID=UPI003FA36D0B